MADDAKFTQPGFDIDGRAFQVHAAVHPDRGRGALLGLAVGDALGTTLEFSHPHVPPLPALVRGPHREITGGGPFRLRPGQVTDDAQQAVTLAVSLMVDGMVRQPELAQRYVAWGRVAFDIGNQTRDVLGLLEQGVPAAEAGRRVWEARAKNAAGNGSLMRTAPIALLYAGSQKARIRASLNDSAITHFDPRCQLACAAYNAAIGAACAVRAEAAGMMAAARLDLDVAAEMLAQRVPDEEPRIREARRLLVADLDAAQAADPEIYGADVHLLKTAGYVRVAFRLAFWHLLHTPSFEDALVDVVNRGGDADTNGAITGALLGAARGEAAIPERWRRAVLEALPASPDDPFSTVYHPRRMLELVEG